MPVRVLMALAMMAVAQTLLIVAAGPASAHVLKTVGPYRLLIGFGNEPACAGAQNSVFLLLTSAKTATRIVGEGPQHGPIAIRAIASVLRPARPVYGQVFAGNPCPASTT